VIRHWLFTIISAVSLLLCTTAVLIWIDSYRVDRIFGYTSFKREGNGWRWQHWECSLLPSRSGFIYQSNLANDVRYERKWGYRPGQWFIRTAPTGKIPSISRTLLQRLWFMWYARPANEQFVVSGMEYRVRVPFWAYVLAFSILPLLWIRKRRRRRVGHECPVCSYNLTANTSGVCPECGTPVPASTTEKPPA